MATAWPHTLFPVIANRRAVKQSTGTALPTCAHTKAWALHWNATLVLPERYLLAGCGGVFRPPSTTLVVSCDANVLFESSPAAGCNAGHITKYCEHHDWQSITRTIWSSPCTRY